LVVEGVPPMKDVWNRIHEWLDVNAPEGYGRLRPGASAEAIRAAGKAMGLILPADGKASYRIHDGQGNEPGLIGGEGWCLLSLQEMVENWNRCSQADEASAYRLPVAWGGLGDYVFLDFGSELQQSGVVMVQRHDRHDPDPIAPSFRDWLEEFADKLDDGEFMYSEEDGCIMYADEIDID
jgi:cell wall assembly regulator SMI1